MQAALMQRLAMVECKRNPTYAMLFAVPNGADYGGKSQTGARMRAEGLKKGVPDMFWPYGAQQFDHLLQRPSTLRWAGLWIELKRPGLHTIKNGGRSDDQVRWHQWLRQEGWPVVTAYGWRAAVRSMLLYERGLLPQRGPDCQLMWEGCPDMPELAEDQW